MSDQLRSGSPRRGRSSGVTITVVLALTVITLACIGAGTYLSYIFLQNPPW